MRKARLVLLTILLPFSAGAATPQDDAEDWRLIGGVLALVQKVVSAAANSPDVADAQRKMDQILSGGDPEANRVAAGVMSEVLEDVPAAHRGAFLAIGRDLLTLARREQAMAARAAGPAATPRDATREEAVRARKELHAMGLRYWDEQQFLDAVRRGDRIAVELYVAARGLEPRNPPPAR